MMDNPEPIMDRTQIRLLVVDDESNIRDPLVRALALEGYKADGAASGEQALSLLQETSYTLMIIDLQMGGIDGIELMRRSRRLQPQLLSIVLTGHASLESAIAAVKLHTVDFLQKPVSIRKLISTVDRVLKKHADQLYREQLLDAIGSVINTIRPLTLPSQPTAANNQKKRTRRFVHAGPITLDCQNRQVMINHLPDNLIDLTNGETAVLTCLMENEGKVLSCSWMVHEIWGYDMSESEAQSVVRPYVSRLRSKIREINTEPKILRTVRGRGYVFIVPR